MKPRYTKTQYLGSRRVGRLCIVLAFIFAFSTICSAQGNVKVKFRILDSELDFASGAEVRVEWGLNNIVQKTADRQGWARAWDIPFGSVATVTLGQRPVEKGLLLGQQFALAVPLEIPTGRDKYNQVGLFTQPVASTVFIESKGETIEVPYTNGMTITPVDEPAGTVFNFAPQVGLLPNENSIIHTQPFFDVQFPAGDYIAGAHFVVPDRITLGDNGFVVGINLQGYGELNMPSVRGVVITEGLAAPAELFSLNPFLWDGERLFVHVTGQLHLGHQIILLERDGSPLSPVDWYAGAPALQVSQADALTSDLKVAVTQGKDEFLGDRNSGSDPSIFSATSIPATIASDDPPQFPDCDSGGDPPDPAVPNCDSWTATPASLGPFSPGCPAPTASGPAKCECSWKKISGQNCGSAGTTVNVVTTTTWEVNATVGFEIGPLEFEVGDSYTGETSVDTGVVFTNGAHSLGQCATTFSGICVKGRIWCGKTDKWRYLRFDHDIIPIMEPCALEVCRSSKVVNTIETFTQVCNITP